MSTALFGVSVSKDPAVNVLPTSVIVTSHNTEAPRILPRYLISYFVFAGDPLNPGCSIASAINPPPVSYCPDALNLSPDISTMTWQRSVVQLPAPPAGSARTDPNPKPL